MVDMRESELKRGCDVGTSPPTGRILLILCAAIVLPVGLWKLSDDVINPPILVAALVMYSIIVLSVMTVLSHRRVTLLDPLLYIACTYYCAKLRMHEESLAGCRIGTGLHNP